MSNDKPELVRGPETLIYTYPPPVPCAACGGSGKIALLTSARDCEACEGAGPERGSEVVVLS
jgi:DnaJ-class molecular chaperone